MPVRVTFLVALLLACNNATAPMVGGGDSRVDGGPLPNGDAAAGDSTGADASTNGDTLPPAAGDERQPPAGDTAISASCATLPPAPTFDVLTGYSGSEDFAFDDAGNLVSTSNGGHLVRQAKGGNAEVFVPNIGETAGTVFLPSGELVVASVAQDSLLIIHPNGANTTLLAGLSYPNGVTADMAGFVYVAEQNAGRVRRVDPSDGSFIIVGEDLHNPNGLAFDATYQHLYVGSFGGGTVHRITRDGAGGWLAPELFASVTSGVAGECTIAGEWCKPGFNYGACDDALACDVSLTSPQAMRDLCAGETAGTPCTVATPSGDVSGECKAIIGGMACKIESGCAQSGPGAACISSDAFTGVHPGRCTAGLCLPADVFAGSGGLDGITVDQCGNVYVTEWTVGVLWRASADGQQVEELLDLPSVWIPNLHWGNGIGGWESDKLYVMDRDQGRVFELDIGVGGIPLPYP